jgi:hypothetical protein
VEPRPTLEEALQNGFARLRKDEDIPVILPIRATIPAWLVRLMDALVSASRALYPDSRFDRQQWAIGAAADALRRKDPPLPDWIDSPIERYTLDVLFNAFDPDEKTTMDDTRSTKSA